MTPSYFKSNSYIDGGNIKNVDIIQSSLDMNNEPITSVQDPINPQDAATKAYIDSLGEIIIITLTGTSYTVVSSKLKGAVHLIAEAIVNDGPCATFSASKTNSTKHPNVARLTASPGNSVNKERLDIKWEPGSGIEIHKNNTGFDGDYRIKLF